MNLKEKKFEIKATTSALLSREEKRKLLWEVWDILLTQDKNFKKEKYEPKRKANFSK